MFKILLLRFVQFFNRIQTACTGLKMIKNVRIQTQLLLVSITLYVYYNFIKEKKSVLLCVKRSKGIKRLFSEVSNVSRPIVTIRAHLHIKLHQVNSYGSNNLKFKILIHSFAVCFISVVDKHLEQGNQ